MKTIKTLGLALAAAGMMTITAQAVPIVGSIGFTGTYTQNGGTIGDLSTATSMTINTVGVDIATDDLTGAGAPLSFASPIGVNGNLPLIGQLWSVTVGTDTFTFAVTSQSQTFTSAIQVNLAGTGVMSDGTGPKDDTTGTWQLGFGRTGAAFTWQSTSATNVPDGGATLILLGSAIVGLFGFARKFGLIA